MPPVSSGILLILLPPSSTPTVHPDPPKVAIDDCTLTPFKSGSVGSSKAKTNRATRRRTRSRVSTSVPLGLVCLQFNHYSSLPKQASRLLMVKKISTNITLPIILGNFSKVFENPPSISTSSALVASRSVVRGVFGSVVSRGVIFIAFHDIRDAVRANHSFHRVVPSSMVECLSSGKRLQCRFTSMDEFKQLNDNSIEQTGGSECLSDYPEELDVLTTRLDLSSLDATDAVYDFFSAHGALVRFERVKNTITLANQEIYRLEYYDHRDTPMHLASTYDGFTYRGVKIQFLLRHANAWSSFGTPKHKDSSLKSCAGSSPRFINSVSSGLELTTAFLNMMASESTPRGEIVTDATQGLPEAKFNPHTPAQTPQNWNTHSALSPTVSSSLSHPCLPKFPAPNGSVPDANNIYPPSSRSQRPNSGKSSNGCRGAVDTALSYPSYSAEQQNEHRFDIARIIQGLETRTSVIIKNIPNQMSLDELDEFIQRICPRRIDFLYLRMDFTTGCNSGYAFVNFLSVQDLLHFAESALFRRWPTDQEPLFKPEDSAVVLRKISRKRGPY
ncbi:hypothetical protein VNI00_013865 [Paramarasmius palmivorus]|uniref:Mei2-like C-terminal RNA recognition motif domain-containing protein n=1 Tax=Paramarasmius palmivorus TaxID=297713 RepID=A0AAW0BX55_9AGAR